MKIILSIILVIISISCNKNRQIVECGNTVTLAYKISDENKMRLDESFLHNQFNNIKIEELFRFTVCNKEVIPGWDSVILGCKIGKVYTFTINPELAYQQENIYHDIKANSTLTLKFKIFKIE